MRRSLVIVGLCLPLAVLSGGSSATAHGPAAQSRPSVSPSPTAHDYNGDGYADLAIGIPGQRVNGHARAGAVEVIYGSHNGLQPAGNQLWTVDSAGIPGKAAANDLFGWAVASGDFNDDGYDDLAIGSPGHGSFFDGVNHPKSGAVYVLFGGAHGLRVRSSYIVEVGAAGYEYGYALAVTDMLDANGPGRGGDGYADLAVGAPGKSWVYVRSGLDISHRPNHYGEFATSAGAAGTARLGASLAAGTFTSAGPAIAVGAPLADVPVGSSVASQAGQVVVIDGVSPMVTLTQSSFGGNPAEPGDHFGAALAAADADGSGYDDLYIGVPGEDLTSSIGDNAVNAGAVQLMFTDSGGGFSTAGWTIHQAFSGVPGDNAEGDQFGDSLAVGRVDGNSSVDLVVGIPGKQIRGHAGAGAVDVLLNGGMGLPANIGNQQWTQNSAGVSDAAETGDRFGAAISLGQFGHGSGLDLAIGVPGEDLSGKSNAGAVQVLYGGGVSGPGSAGDQLWSADSPGILGSTHAGNQFGVSVR